MCRAGSLKFRSTEYAHIHWNVALSKRGGLGRGVFGWTGGHKASGVLLECSTAVFSAACFVGQQGITGELFFVYALIEWFRAADMWVIYQSLLSILVVLCSQTAAVSLFGL